MLVEQLPQKLPPQQIRKRDGVTLQPFNVEKITKAVTKAWCSTGKSADTAAIFAVAQLVVDTFRGDTIVDIEDVQESVESALMHLKHFDVMKHYILYRQKRAEARAARQHPDPKAVADYIHAAKYARYLPDQQRRELYEETVARVEQMHLRRFSQFPGMPHVIREAFKFVYEQRVLPSMRSMQFGGMAIEVNNNRMYNCLGQETAFITRDGVKKFSDFNHGDETVVLTHKGNWKKAKVKSYGKQQLFTIRLSRGGGNGDSKYVVRATRDHAWILEDGTRIRDLAVKHKLAKPPQLVGSWKYEDSNPEQRTYWAMGYVYGDGTLVKDGEGAYRYSMVRLCGTDKQRFMQRFEELGYATSSPPSFNGDAIAYTGHYLKTLPSIEVDGFENVVAFVRGYLDADGSKNTNGEWPSPFVGIQASGGESIEFIRKMFPVVGAYITSERDLTGQETNYGIRPETVDFGLVLGFGNSPVSPYIVREIVESTTETVWCLEVEDDHSFVLANGIVTGNCCATHLDRIEAFSEGFFLLLSGCGVGYSVQFKHIDKLPELAHIDETKVIHHVVGDSIEGWADAALELLRSAVDGTHIEFAYHNVRREGATLKTSGGKAPGHLALKRALEGVRAILLEAQGRRLRPVEAHRIMCLFADAVLSGGIRRSAMICLFSLEDSEMMYLKTGKWFEREPWLANANNSVVLKRDDVKHEQFARIFTMTRQFGEPGFVFVADTDEMRNPCAEISLNPRLLINYEVMKILRERAKRGKPMPNVQMGEARTGWAFCNLCEINGSKLKTLADFKATAEAAATIGTLQAAHTDMPYLGWVSEVIAEREALLGIGMTGMMDSPEVTLNPDYQREVAALVVERNAEIAERIGIRVAARTTTVKPSGTTSLELGNVGSGHHPHHARRYIRRVTANELETVFLFFKEHNPHMCVKKPDGDWVIEFPVEAPEGARVKSDFGAVQFLESVKSTQLNWVAAGTARPESSPGYVHNVSNTTPVRPEEWGEVAEYLWSNRDAFAGVSFLPVDDKIYAFAPFEAVVTEADEARWNQLVAHYKPVDYHALREEEDTTDVLQEPACASGACDIVGKGS